MVCVEPTCWSAMDGLCRTDVLESDGRSVVSRRVGERWMVCVEPTCRSAIDGQW